MRVGDLDKRRLLCGSHAMEGCVLREDGTIAEVAEPFAGFALQGIALDDGSQHFDSVVDCGAGREETV